MEGARFDFLKSPNCKYSDHPGSKTVLDEEAHKRVGSAARTPAALCTYWETGPLSFGNAPRTANAHTEPSSSSVGNSSGGVSEASFDEARRRFRLGILMLVLPGRLAQHDKDIGRAARLALWGV